MTTDNLNVQTLNDNSVLIIPGQALDNSNAHLMVDAITSAQAGGVKNIIIDMAELEFLSSAGVGAILGTIETSREAGGDIVLCSVPDSIRHVLDVLDLTDFLTIADDREQANAQCG
jgi:anti-anti-sigma factor